MTYLFGTLGVILFVRSAAPKLLGINLAAVGEGVRGGAGPRRGEGRGRRRVHARRAARVPRAHGAPADGRDGRATSCELLGRRAGSGG